jgi:hypothetical protein
LTTISKAPPGSQLCDEHLFTSLKTLLTHNLLLSRVAVVCKDMSEWTVSPPKSHSLIDFHKNIKETLGLSAAGVGVCFLCAAGGIFEVWGRIEQYFSRVSPFLTPPIYGHIYRSQPHNWHLTPREPASQFGCTHRQLSAFGGVRLALLADLILWYACDYVHHRFRVIHNHVNSTKVESMM